MSKRKTSFQSDARPAAGSVRIIAGRWRGSRLPVAAAPGLRPTSDRVRETLFNWLMPYLPGAVVLDAFAGSGALGLEAASRGAAAVWLLERDAGLARSLQQQVQRLAGAGEVVQVRQVDALAHLATASTQFDIAFLDPPFADNFWPQLWPLLLPRMRAGGLLYVEQALTLPAPQLPTGWHLHREGRTREVAYRLYRHQAAGE